MTWTTRFLFLAALLLPNSAGALAESFELIRTFQAEVPAFDDYFGTSVVLEGDLVAIKSHSGSRDGDGLSITHVFEEIVGHGWAEVATLEFDNGDNAGNYFIGQELAIDQGQIVIGYGTEHERARQLVIQFASRDEGWNVRFNEPTPRELGLSRTIISPPGRTVDISGNFAIAEDPRNRRLDGGKGLARVYERNPAGTWHEVANLVPEQQRDFAGVFSAAIEGTTAAVIDRGDAGRHPGGLYFFERGGDGDWSQTKSFTADSDGFTPGYVEIDGDIAVVASFFEKAVTIYENDPLLGWQQSTALDFDRFLNRYPASVAIDGNLLAFGNFDSDAERSSVDVYRRSELGEWLLVDRIYDPGLTAQGEFGSSIAVDANRILIGATWVIPQIGPKVPGAAYLFELVPEPNSAVIALLGLSIGSLARRRLRTG